MGALRLDPAEHFQFKGHGIAVGRGGAVGVDAADRKMPVISAPAGLQRPPGFREIADVAGAVAGRVGIGDVLGDHGLPGRRVLGTGAGKSENLEPVEHQGLLPPRLHGCLTVIPLETVSDALRPGRLWPEDLPMPADVFDPLRARLRAIRPAQSVGRVDAIGRDHVRVSGLDRIVALGDRVRVGDTLAGEVLGIDAAGCTVMPEGAPDGVRLGAAVTHLGPASLAPHHSWLGRVIDPDGRPMDGRPIFPGPVAYPLLASPPPPTERRGLGPRLRTGFAVFDTLLPIVRGQRIGLFAGSGVGKSRLIAALAQGMAADVVVIGLIGERGRELRDFIADTLGPEGLARAVVVAATSDRPALTRARAAWAMMAVAEYFRDQGLQVLLLADSITRFAEAQRDVAAAVGEPFGPAGFPASMAQMVMALAERAGPGVAGQGDITAVLSVLVAGSDMEGPVADVMRGVLDGHVLLSREIAERGRYPAIDLLRSVSRALPAAASVEEGRLILRARQLLGAHDRAEMMIQAGLYAAGSDPVTDAAILAWPALDAFVGTAAAPTLGGSFTQLGAILDAAEPGRRGSRTGRQVFDQG